MKLLKFEQNICTPCKELNKFLTEDLMVKPDEIYVLDGDSDEDREKAGEYGIMSTPVLILTDDDGVEIRRIAGARDRGAITAIFTERGLI